MDKLKNRIIITPENSSVNYWKDLIRYKELFYVLSWRDIKVRYKQTAIGVLWAVLRPLLTMIIFTVVFGYFAQLPSTGDYPYFLLVFCGMLPWHFFAAAVAESGNSLVNNQQLITKVYFPRIIIPLSAVVTSFIDFIISFCLFLCLLVFFKVWPSSNIVYLPFFLLLLLVLILGFGFLLTAFNVKYRDFRYIIPFIIQIGLYISPVGYSSSIVPEEWKVIYFLNPMAGVVEGFRWCLLGEGVFELQVLSSAIIVSICLFALGFIYFRKMERYFADLI